MKYKKQAGGLKFEIKVGSKTFNTGERTVENSWLTGKLTGRPAFAIFDELYCLNDVSIFILHVLLLMAGTKGQLGDPFFLNFFEKKLGELVIRD